jgi:hypothetical protein
LYQRVLHRRGCGGRKDGHRQKNRHFALLLNERENRSSADETPGAATFSRYCGFVTGR